MNKENLNILIINAGSSSIKLAFYEMNEKPVLKISGKIERIDLNNATFIINSNKDENSINQKINSADFNAAILFLINWLEKQEWFISIHAIGHRIVHGLHHTQPEIITDNLLNELNSISNYDPEHLPAEIAIIKMFKQKHSQLLQVACFDTAFHTTIPAVARTFAIPKNFSDEGIHRYGFHGISYSYLMKELQRSNKAGANGRIILAHLGNGASIAAVKDGKSVDTSMGFTPAGGIVMSTRSGDIDPGIAWFLIQQGMDAKSFNDLINHQSGLLGISGISADMQDLLQYKNTDKDAALAIDIFCYQIKKYIGAYAAVLNGLDVLVFSGGIGENAPEIRARICEELGYLNIELNEESNNKNEHLISGNNSAVKVYVISTNEELMIAENAVTVYRNSTIK